MAENTGEGPFERAVIGLNGGPTDELVVRFACELAKPYKAALIAVHVVEVDWRHDLDEDIAGQDEAASAILDLAEGVAERLQVKLETDLLQARDVGAALVDEATELGADMIIIGLPYRKRFGGDFAIGRTVPYVLQNAPCAVTVVREAMPVESDAADRPMAGASAGGDRRGQS